MKLIRNVWSHLSLEDGEKSINKDIRKSDPYEVNSFRFLVKKIAQISFHNPEWSLYYRGQNEDFENRRGLSSLYPSIYRSSDGLLVSERILRRRFLILLKAEEELLDAFNEFNLDGYTKLKHFREIRWAILQHYERCKTPLFDITHSLRVACSFALNNIKDYAFLYVLGLPHVHGSISYFVEEELFNIKLSSICPPKAIRPYYQEGYLVGTFPIDEGSRSITLDVGRRLIAKFYLNKRRFWDRDFQAIPNKALSPERDPMKRICNEILCSIN